MNQIIRHDPFGVLLPIDRAFSRLFEREPLAGDDRNDRHTLSIDIEDDGTSFTLRASLPGFDRDQIDVEVHDDVVTIRATREQAEEVEGKNFLRRERFTGTATRTLRLPAAVDDEQANAELKDGVLTLTLPRRVENGRRKLSIN